MSGREPIMVALLALFTDTIASTFTGTASYGSAVITDIASTTGLFVGMPTDSARTPTGATILSIDSATQVTLSAAALTAGGNVVFTTGFRTAGRRLKFATATFEQPALFLQNTGEQVDRGPTRMPARVTMECAIWLFSSQGADPDAVPAATLNYLIDAIETVLKPAPVIEAQTLGGIVTHCWIDGMVEIHPGDLDGQAIAVIPVKILVPSPV